MKNNKNIKKVEKKQLDENFLRYVVVKVNQMCTDFFGESCKFHEKLLIDRITGKGTEAFSIEWENLIQKIENLPINYRQCMVIKIAADIHDYQMSSMDEAVEIYQYYKCTHWWLIGVDEIRRIAELPEVYTVLKEARIIRTNEPSLCPNDPKVVRKNGNTLYEGFKQEYNSQAQNQQEKYGVNAKNLKNYLLKGRRFYKYLPDHIVASIAAEPMMAVAMARDIKEKCVVRSEKREKTSLEKLRNNA